MATSGSKTIAVTSWDNLVFSWSATSQSVANNTTTVSWSLKLVSTSSGRIESTASKDWKVTVNGTSYSGTNTVGIGNNSTKTLASGSTVIKHDADGSKTFSYSFSQEFGITFSGSSIGTITGSGSGTLNTIPRKSTPTLSASTIEMGKTVTIYTNRAASSFTHKLYYGWYGTQWYEIATGVATSYTWTIPLTFANNIPDSTKGWGTIRCETYSGNTLIGTADVTFTATVPASMKPTCTVTVTDPTGYADTYGNPVKGLSKFKVVVTPTISYGSTIKTYSTTANGSKYTTASFITGVLKSSGTHTVSSTVTDNRGRTGSASKSLTVLNYNAPSISRLTVGRCDSDGVANEQGAYVKVTFSATVTALNNKNTATYTLKYKKTTETEYIEITLSDIKNSYSVSNSSKIFAADTGSSYDVEITVKDNHSTVSRITSASTAFTLMHFGADGKSIGFLKVAEHTGAVDFGGDVYLNGHAMYGAHGMFDTRSENATPEWYMTNYGRGTVWEFKELTVIGFTSPSTKFAPVQTIIPWKDSSGGLPRQVTYEGRTRWTRIASSTTAWGSWLSDALIAYPVGSIYISYSHTNPGTLFGGTWERLTGGFLWASAASDIIGQTGGERTVTLTEKQIPSHNHGGTYTNAGSGTKTHSWLASGGSSMAYDTVNAGGGEAHNNMPPYIQVSIWRRTA